jgi:hypothetical protein
MFNENLGHWSIPTSITHEHLCSLMAFIFVVLLFLRVLCVLRGERFALVLKDINVQLKP